MNQQPRKAAQTHKAMIRFREARHVLCWLFWHKTERTRRDGDVNHWWVCMRGCGYETNKPTIPGTGPDVRKPPYWEKINQTAKP